MAKKQITIRLPDGDLADLERLANVKGDDRAGRAAYLIQKGIEKAIEDGTLPREDVSEQIEKLQSKVEAYEEYIQLLLGGREREGVSFAVIAKYLEVSSVAVEGLYRELEECRKKAAKKST